MYVFHKFVLCARHVSETKIHFLKKKPKHFTYKKKCCSVKVTQKLIRQKDINVHFSVQEWNLAQLPNYLAFHQYNVEQRLVLFRFLLTCLSFLCPAVENSDDYWMWSCVGSGIHGENFILRIQTFKSTYTLLIHSTFVFFLLKCIIVVKCENPNIVLYLFIFCSLEVWSEFRLFAEREFETEQYLIVF